jgi:hypothetical protein
VEQALSVLAGGPLSPTIGEQVIEDTLLGVPAAKRAWTECIITGISALGFRR